MNENSSNLCPVSLSPLKSMVYWIYGCIKTNGSTSNLSDVLLRQLNKQSIRFAAVISGQTPLATWWTLFSIKEGWEEQKWTGFGQRVLEVMGEIPSDSKFDPRSLSKTFLSSSKPVCLTWPEFQMVIIWVWNAPFTLFAPTAFRRKPVFRGHGWLYYKTPLFLRILYVTGSQLT